MVCEVCRRWCCVCVLLGARSCATGWTYHINHVTTWCLWGGDSGNKEHQEWHMALPGSS